MRLERNGVAAPIGSFGPISMLGRIGILLAFSGAWLCGSIRSATAHPPIQLSEIADGDGGFVIIGQWPGGRLGNSVARAGDVNGDGLGDVIVGAFVSPGNSVPSGGRSYVVFGKADGAPVQALDIGAGSGGFEIIGEGQADFAGRDVGGIGDMNADGYDDVIVSAYEANNNYLGPGKIYVVFGKADTASVNLSDVRMGIGGFAIDGEAIGDRAGDRAGGAGDVNGDGIPDIVISASFADISYENSGRSYVVFGKRDTATVNLSDIAAGQGGFAINDVGRVIAGAGDVNGDGLGDLIGDGNGSGFVIFGKTDTSTLHWQDLVDGNGGFAIPQTGSVSWGAGDVNGDGFGDIVIAAVKSYIIFGKQTSEAVTEAQLDAGIGGFRILADGPIPDSYGQSSSTAGDFNGDGLADVVIGATGIELTMAQRIGGGYLVLGKTDTAAVSYDSIVGGTTGFVMYGVLTNATSGLGDSTGLRVSGGGDLNGDGMPDLIIAAPSAAEHPLFNQFTGRTYAVRSRIAPPLEAPAGVPQTATYRARTIAGDGPGGLIVPVTKFEAARVAVDFSDADFGTSTVSASFSTEVVTLYRTRPDLSPEAPPPDTARVMWELASDRENFDSAQLTFKYLNHEIAGVLGDETRLKLFNSSSIAGPWSMLPTQIDATRNEAKTTVTALGFFALANPGGEFGPFVQDYTEAGGTTHGWTGGTVDGFGGTTEIDANGLCMDVGAAGDHYVMWISPERMVELLGDTVYRARISMTTTQTSPDAIPFFSFMYDNFLSAGGGNNFGGWSWVLDVDGGAQGIGRPQGRTDYDFYLTPLAVATAQWASGAFTPAADLENDMRLQYRIIDANDSLVTDADSGTVCVGRLEVTSMPRASLTPTSIFNAPIATATHFFETPDETGSGGAFINDLYNFALYSISETGDARKTLGYYDPTRPNRNLQLYPVAWEAETLYRVRSLMREISGEIDPVDAIILSLDVTTVEIGASSFATRGAPGSPMDRVASPKLTGGEYEAYLFGQNATLSLTPDANRLRPLGIFFNTENIAGGGTGGDPLRVDTLGVDRMDAGQ